MPVQGLVRLRRHLFGRQQSLGTVVPATRAYPFKGVPEVELNWTDPEVDLGSLDPIAAPHREAPALTAPLTDPQLAYNSIPIILSGFFGGGVEPTGGGTAQTWVFSPASATLDPLDVYTYQFGDDVLTDWYQLGDGILETFEITGPEGLGPVTTSLGWRFGSVASTGSTDSPVTGAVPTPGVALEPNEALVYLKDCAIYIADTTAGLAAGQIIDALHTITIRGSGDIDEKRYANGTQTFDVSAWARATRAIEIEATFAKTVDTVGLGSESDAWISDQAVDRYLRLIFTSTAEAQGGTPYSWTITTPCRYYTRTEGESGGNTVIVLTAHAFYDPDDLDGVFETTVVNTLTAAELGLAGS
jgi:hypothetical protein